MTDKIDVAALRELVAKATPGPWMVYSEPEVGLPPSLFYGKPLEGCGPLEPLQGYDLELVVAAVNVLPASSKQPRRRLGWRLRTRGCEKR